MLALVAVLLAACVPESPVVTPPPEPTATPLFASDEEALAAAEEAYRRFLAVIDHVLANGGQYANELSDLATDEVIAKEQEAFETFRINEWRLTGTSVPDVSIQRIAGNDVTIYSCDDISGTDVVDASGASVVDPGRPMKVPFEITLTFNSESLVISDRTRWEGSGVC